MDFNCQDNEAIVDPTANFLDMFSVFFDEGEIIDGSSRSSSDDESTDSSGGAAAQRNTEFWKAQHQLLHDALHHRTSSVEKRILSDTEVVVAGIRLAGSACQCSGRPIEGHCRKCVMRVVADKLREAGYNSAICNSKWKISADILSGYNIFTHISLIIIMSHDSCLVCIIWLIVEYVCRRTQLHRCSGIETKKGTVRVLIELSFRAEFEMARVSPEYNSLVSCLPEIFVGKSEKLQGVIKIVCAAAKKCKKENKMHLAPWRKHKYMQSKWLGMYQRMWAGTPLLPVAITRIMDRQPRQRSSMLTFDLHFNTSVKVL